MKKSFSLILLALLLLGGNDLFAQSKKSSGGKRKKQTLTAMEGRQKVRESDYGTFDKFTSFSTKDKTVYFCPFDYTKLHEVTNASHPEWGELRPVINYLQTVSRATMTMCAVYAINPDITDPSERNSLLEKAKNEATASVNAFNDWKVKQQMRNKTQYMVAEVDYRYFKGANFYNEQRSEGIIPVGLLLYFGSRKAELFISDTTGRKFPDIKFFPNDATIVESWNSVLDEVANYLKRNDRKSVMLIGYADNQGTEAYVQGISRQRAVEVKKALLLRGIDASRIEVEVKGDADPVGDNSTYEGRIANNRVSINVQ